MPQSNEKYLVKYFPFITTHGRTIFLKYFLIYPFLFFLFLVQMHFYDNFQTLVVQLGGEHQKRYQF